MEGEGRLVPALVAEALRSSGALSAFPTFEVVSAYTHLVLRCRPPAGGPGWILKFWRNGSRRPIDAYAHRLLRRRIPVPTIVSSGRVRVPETGCLTLRFPVVRGESIAFTLYEEIENAEPASRWESRWPETMRRQLYARAGAWLRMVHDARTFERSGPLAKFGEAWQGTARDWTEFFSLQIQRWDRELADFHVPRRDRRLRRWVRDGIVSGMQRLSQVPAFVLCHRDYSLRNLLVRQDGELAAVIDFEHAIAGDPVYDWHRMAAHLLVIRREPELWEHFVTGYGGIPDEEAEVRLLFYLGFYGISGMHYSLKEEDPVFYRQSLDLLQWVKNRLQFL